MKIKNWRPEVDLPVTIKSYTNNVTKKSDPMLTFSVRNNAGTSFVHASSLNHTLILDDNTEVDLADYCRENFS